jgi:hypothetical protein
MNHQHSFFAAQNAAIPSGNTAKSIFNPKIPLTYFSGQANVKHHFQASTNLNQGLNTCEALSVFSRIRQERLERRCGKPLIHLSIR